MQLIKKQDISMLCLLVIKLLIVGFYMKNQENKPVYYNGSVSLSNIKVPTSKKDIVVKPEGDFSNCKPPVYPPYMIHR